MRGFGFKFVVKCSCGRVEINSGPLINTGFEINRRIVFVMQLLGIGRESINIFSGLMDMSKGLAIGIYDRIVEHMCKIIKFMFDKLRELLKKKKLKMWKVKGL